MPTASVDGHDLYYELHEAETTDVDRPPLVLVTGLGGRCAGWLLYQVPFFRRERRVLIYDHRGVGASDPRDGAFSTADLGRDLTGLLDALEWPTVDAAGAFLGGMAIQEAALARPERFRRLVLFGCWARPDARRRLLLREWAALARLGVPAATMVRQRILWTLSDASLERTDLIEAAIERLDDGRTPLTGEGFARQCEACAEHDTFDRLGDLHHPTLLVCGREDQLTPPRFGRAMAAAMPNARDIALAYGGHAVLLERADRCNEIAGHFLDEENAAGP